MYLLTIGWGNAFTSVIFAIFGDLMSNVALNIVFLILGTLNFLWFLSVARSYRYVTFYGDKEGGGEEGEVEMGDRTT
jgi:hypothetical protein